MIGNTKRCVSGSGDVEGIVWEIKLKKQTESRA